MMRRTVILWVILFAGIGNAIAEDAELPDAPESRTRDDAARKTAPTEYLNLSIEEPTGVLTLDRVAELVLLKNPELEAFAWAVRAADARALEAGLRPNPELAVEIDELRLGTEPNATRYTARIGNNVEIERRRERPESVGFSEAEYTIQLSYLIELGRKRPKRLRLAELERDVFEWDYEVAKVAVLGQATADFAETLVLQEQLALVEACLGHADQVLAAMTSHARNGALTAQDLNEATMKRAQYEIDRARVGHALDAARGRLAAAWGAATPKFDRVAGVLDLPSCPRQDDVLHRADHSPELARWAADIEAHAAAAELEKANAVPDLEATVGLRTEYLAAQRFSEIALGPRRIQAEMSRTRYDSERDYTLMVEFRVPLPLFDRNQGAIREAQCLAAATDAGYRAARMRLRTEIVDLHATLAATYDEVRILENKAIPAAADTLEAVKKGLGLGVHTYFDLLDAMENLYDARRDRLDALLAYHQTAAELDGLLGAPCVASQVDESLL